MFKKKKEKVNTEEIVDNTIKLTELEKEQLEVLKSLNQSYSDLKAKIADDEMELFVKKSEAVNLFSQAMNLKYQLDKLFSEKYGKFTQREDGSLVLIEEEEK